MCGNAGGLAKRVYLSGIEARSGEALTCEFTLAGAYFRTPANGADDRGSQRAFFPFSGP